MVNHDKTDIIHHFYSFIQLNLTKFLVYGKCRVEKNCRTKRFFTMNGYFYCIDHNNILLLAELVIWRYGYFKDVLTNGTYKYKCIIYLE